MSHAKIAAFLKGAHPSKIGSVESSSDLFSDGWLDSLLQLKLISFLESELGRRIPPLRLTRKTFLTVNSIAALVDQL